MESKSLRPICSIGMFDFIKGAAISAVVIGHILSLCCSVERHPFLYFITSVSFLLLYSFSIAAGFGFRKLPTRKCLQQIKNMFIVPYVVTALISMFLSAFNNFVVSGSISSAFKQLGITLLRFLLLSDSTVTIFGLTIPDLGALWFFIAIAGGWFILNLILNLPQGWKCHLAVILVGVIGYCGKAFLAAHNIGFIFCFCFFHMLIFVPGLYIGYLAKKHRWFEKKLPLPYIALLCVCIAAFLWKYKTPYTLFNRSNSPLGVFTHFAAAIISFGVIYLTTRINRRETPFVNFFEVLGRNSFYIYCIHSIDYYGIPWDILRAIAPSSSGVYWFIVTLVLRLSFIGLGMLVLNAFRNWGGFKRLFHRKTV